MYLVYGSPPCAHEKGKRAETLKRKRPKVAQVGWKKRKGEVDVSRKRDPSRSEKMGVNCAAREYGVPQTSLLSDRVEHGRTPGPLSYLS